MEMDSVPEVIHIAGARTSRLSSPACPPTRSLRPVAGAGDARTQHRCWPGSVVVDALRRRHLRLPANRNETAFTPDCPECLSCRCSRRFDSSPIRGVVCVRVINDGQWEEINLLKPRRVHAGDISSQYLRTVPDPEGYHPWRIIRPQGASEVVRGDRLRGQHFRHRAGRMHWSWRRRTPCAWINALSKRLRRGGTGHCAAAA